MNLDTYGLKRTSLPETEPLGCRCIFLSTQVTCSTKGWLDDCLHRVSSCVSHTPFPGQANFHQPYLALQSRKLPMNPDEPTAIPILARMPSLTPHHLLLGLFIIPSLATAFIPCAQEPSACCATKQYVKIFADTCSMERSRNPLHMSKGPADGDDGGRQFASSVLASAYLLTSILTGSTAALAVTTDQMPLSDTATPTVVLAARSGGRMGGRSASRSAFRSPSRLPGSATSRRYGQAVIVRPTPVLGPGFGLVSPFGYGYGALGAASVINEGIREARQEGELRDERMELQEVRQKEAELEQRIKLLEQQQQVKPSY